MDARHGRHQFCHQWQQSHHEHKISLYSGQPNLYFGDLGSTISGQLIGELDTMIVAHALAHYRTLVTNNTRHFPPYSLQNWDDAP